MIQILLRIKWFMETEIGIIGGFIRTSEFPKIIDWIKEYNLTDFQCFSNLYDNLSEDVKMEIREWRSEEKDDLYNGNVKELIEFYLTAERENNSIVYVGIYKS